MIDFSKDTNFLKPEINIDFNKLDDLDMHCYKNLLSLLSKNYNINKNQIELFNGFSSAIYSLFKFLNLKHCVIYSPSNLEYKKAALNLNYDVRLIDRFENIYLPVRESSVVIFMNPSFLDGTHYELDKLFEYWISKNVTVIIDESLLDFTHLKSTAKLVSAYDKLYIIKDFSKYFSNSTLSMATVFSNEENIKNLRKFEPSGKLSIYDLNYLEHALGDENFKSIANSVNIKNRIELENIFLNCKYVDKIFQSSSNSILIKLKDEIEEYKEFVDILLKHKIKVISCEEYDFLDSRYINVYVSSKENIEKLKEIISMIENKWL